MESYYSIGVDPDLTTLAWACVHHVLYDNGLTQAELHSFGVIRAEPNTHGLPIIAQIASSAIFPTADFGAIESMKVYLNAAHKVANKVPPRDLLDLERVCGAVLCRLMAQNCMVAPFTAAEWKGQVTKAAHHPQIAQAVRVQYPGFKRAPTLPAGLARSEVSAADWEHIWDAVGLALHAVRKRSMIAALYRTRMAL